MTKMWLGDKFSQTLLVFLQMRPLYWPVPHICACALHFAHWSMPLKQVQVLVSLGGDDHSICQWSLVKPRVGPS